MKKLIATFVSWGPHGLFLASLLDGSGVPVPGGVDVLIVYLASQRPGELFLLTVLAVSGSLLGNLVLFLLARRGGELLLDKRTKSAGALRFRRWFDHYGLLTVFVAALVPLPVMPMKIFVLCAGALGSRVWTFAVVLACARIARYSGLSLLGSAMGTDALAWLRGHVWHLTAFAAALFAVLWFVIQAAERRSLLANE